MTEKMTNKKETGITREAFIAKSSASLRGYLSKTDSSEHIAMTKEIIRAREAAAAEIYPLIVKAREATYQQPIESVLDTYMELLMQYQKRELVEVIDEIEVVVERLFIMIANARKVKSILEEVAVLDPRVNAAQGFELLKEITEILKRPNEIFAQQLNPLKLADKRLKDVLQNIQ